DGDLGSAIGSPVAGGTGSTVGAGDDFISVCGDGGSEDREFIWTAPSTGRFVISTVGSDFDTNLSVRGPACDVEDEIICNDDYGDITSQVFVDVVTGETIVITVEGYDGTESGDFAIN